MSRAHVGGAFARGLGLACLLATSCGTNPHHSPADASLVPYSGLIDQGAPASDQGLPTTDNSCPSVGNAGAVGPGVVTLAGSEEAGHRDCVGVAAQFNNPVNVTVGPTGELFVADFDNDTIRKVSPQGVVTTVLTGPGGFRRPFGLVFASDGRLYVQTDYDSRGTEKVGALWTLDLKSGQASLVLDKIGLLRGLGALHAPSSGLVVADYTGHVVLRFDPETKAMTTLAGSRGKSGYADGTGSAARFSAPYDVVVTSSHEIIVADEGNHRLRQITLSGQTSTWAGDGVAGSLDGPRLGARFNKPRGLAIDSAQNVYVTEVDGHVIRKVSTAGQVTTIAGDGVPGFLDAADPLQARFFGLEGLDITGDGKLLSVADGNEGTESNYHRVRRVTLEP